ncbi:MAG: ABC transporter permease [bacterium]
MLQQALNLILTLDPVVVEIAGLSLRVSTMAVCLAAAVGLPAGLVIGLSEFPGRRLVITLFNALMAMPTVVVGLMVYFILSRSGPIGFMGMLYTPWAIVIGEFILILPLVTGLSISATMTMDRRVVESAILLGASRLRMMGVALRENRFGFAAAVIAAFGRAIAEVGVAVMVGGNIAGHTRTLTTAAVLETTRGEFQVGIAMGIILLVIALAVNLLFQAIQGMARKT